MLSVCVSIPFLGSPRSVMTRTFTTCPTVEKTWRNLSSVVELLTFPMKICHFESFDMVLAWLAAAAAGGRVWCGAWVQVGWGQEAGEARVGLGCCRSCVWFAALPVGSMGLERRRGQC